MFSFLVIGDWCYDFGFRISDFGLKTPRFAILATISDLGLLFRNPQSAIPNGGRYAEDKDEEFGGEADASDREGED